jgi:hypothetical protein
MGTLYALSFVFVGTTSPDADGLTPLHPPRPAPVPVEMMSFERPNYYDRWQYFAVDRDGYFRPRVVLDPVMPFYLIDGKPYPLLGIRPLDMIPFLVD